jgi:hypothetical protein
MKRTNFSAWRALGFIAFLLVLLVSACSDGGGEDDIWLDDLSNPFIGKWESKIPSMGNAVMISEYSTDGTFTALFPDYPEYGTMAGGYLVKGNVLVTFLSSDGGIGGYTFKVADNDTINVTEIDEVNDNGTFVSGNTAAFARFPGSIVNKENKPFALTNILTGGTGKWKETATPYEAEYLFKVNATGTVTYTEGGQQMPFDIVYSAFTDVGVEGTTLIIFMSGPNTFTAYSFATAGNDNTITVKEITDVSMGAQGPSVTYGTAVPFSRN